MAKSRKYQLGTDKKSLTDNFRFDFRGTNFEGQPADLRVTVLRKRNDLYTWQFDERGSEGWKEMARLDYSRSAS